MRPIAGFVDQHQQTREKPLIGSSQRSDPMTISELCQFVSSKHPSLWPKYVLDTKIFGNTQVAMGRDFTVSLLDALLWTELCPSKGEAKNFAKNGAIRVNGEKCSDITRILSGKDALGNLDAIVLECGRRNYGLIELC